MLGFYESEGSVHYWSLVDTQKEIIKINAITVLERTIVTISLFQSPFLISYYVQFCWKNICRFCEASSGMQMNNHIESTECKPEQKENTNSLGIQTENWDRTKDKG